MSDRLQDLQRQRALVQQQLDWFDREIAAATPPPAASEAAPPAARRLKPSPVAPSSTLRHQADAILGHSAAPAPTPVSPRQLAAADAILDEYRVAPDTLKTDIRKGCFLYFAVALALVGAGIALLYLVLSKGK